MNISEAGSSKILFVTQRLSDFVEMKRAAISLKKFGYQCIILFCGVDSPMHDSIVLKEIEKSIAIGEVDGLEISNKKLLINAGALQNSTNTQPIKYSSTWGVRNLLIRLNQFYKASKRKLIELK
ncbi:hypothetical protein, partial [Legionella pneumophila]